MPHVAIIMWSEVMSRHYLHSSVPIQSGDIPSQKASRPILNFYISQQRQTSQYRGHFKHFPSTRQNCTNSFLLSRCVCSDWGEYIGHWTHSCILRDKRVVHYETESEAIEILLWIPTSLNGSSKHQRHHKTSKCSENCTTANLVPRVFLSTSRELFHFHKSKSTCTPLIKTFTFTEPPRQIPYEHVRIHVPHASRRLFRASNRGTTHDAPLAAPETGSPRGTPETAQSHGPARR